MVTRDEVEEFLNHFFEKLKVYDIVFMDNRGKNVQALAELEITPLKRLDVIRKMTVEDYSEGPIANTLNELGDLWVFGKDVRGYEVYIKISLGIPNNRTICISFHKSEYQMKYPFKK